MFQSIFKRLVWKEFAIRTWAEANDDDIFGNAAKLAYYFMLALFPMLIFLISLIGFLPQLQENIFRALGQVAPADAMKLVSETIHDVVSKRSGGLLSFGLLAALWAASGGVTAVMDSLNQVYDVKETRSFWKTRFTAIVLTLSLALLVVAGTALIMFGDKFIIALAHWFGLGPMFTVLWGIIDYGLGLGLLFIALEVLYYFGPDIKQQWKWITPGAIFAVLAMILASLLFSLYLRLGPSYSATYGGLGAVIVLMLWLYLIGIIVLLGGEINSEFARQSDQIPKESNTSNNILAGSELKTNGKPIYEQ